MDTGIVTTYLRAFADGDQSAGDRVFELLYQELSLKAKVILRRERDQGAWQTAELVHEVWDRLIRDKELQVKDRRHFLVLAARAMRRALVEHVRSRNTQKRGGGYEKIDLSQAMEADAERLQPLDILEINDALELLAKRSEDLARLVDLRFFAGLSIDEAADALGVHRTTIVRNWRAAKAALSIHLGNGDD